MTVPILDFGLGTPWEQGRALWVFGYGTLMYRVDFPIEAQVFGYIHGCKRAFLQKSHDHRGTPSQPGRVCTLLPAADSIESVCWGVAYKAQSGKEHEVKALLDYREKDRYYIEFVSVYTKQGVLCDVMVDNTRTVVAHAALAEPQRMGSDPRMQWREDIQRWYIKCYNSGYRQPQVFYAPQAAWYNTPPKKGH
ncbi:Cation transport regulator-like protein 2 [Coemansia aciculifera]|nr:Cation transport regulator-like protein 2 [Coemansia aciculifera]